MRINGVHGGPKENEDDLADPNWNVSTSTCLAECCPGLCTLMAASGLLAMKNGIN